MAIDMGVTLTARPTDGAWSIENEEHGALDVAHRPVELDGVLPSWARFAFAVAETMDHRGGLEGRITSTLPAGSGLSSSAALEVAIALALGAPAADVETAERCRRAETAASGVPCGIMDQLASLMGVEGHALHMDCSTLETTPVPMPPSARVVIVHSGRPRRLDESAYASRAAQCASAMEQLGSLRGVDVGAVRSLRDPEIRRRARHVVTENERVAAFVDCLRRDDVTTAGALMSDSHRSLRDDFEVSTPELDDLVELLERHDGVAGARLTGAGFGGCVVALCDPDVDPRPAGRRGWIVRAAAGAHRRA